MPGSLRAKTPEVSTTFDTYRRAIKQSETRIAARRVLEWIRMFEDLAGCFGNEISDLFSFKSKISMKYHSAISKHQNYS